jgi:peptide subunit release factor RF-3
MSNPEWRLKYGEKTSTYRLPISLGERIKGILDSNTTTVQELHECLDKMDEAYWVAKQKQNATQVEATQHDTQEVMKGIEEIKQVLAEMKQMMF